MMEPPLEYCDIGANEEEEEEKIDEIAQEEEQDPVFYTDSSRTLLVEAEWLGLEEKETQHCKTPFIAMLFNSQTNFPDLGSMEDIHSKGPESIKCMAEPKTVEKMRIIAVHTPICQILQPQMFASVLAVLIGIIPGLKSFAFGSNVPLGFLTDSLDIVAEAAIPSAMLVLGGMLTECPNESKLGIKTTLGIIIGRLLVLPLIGIGVVFLAAKWNLLIQGDDLYQFVIFLQYTTPSAIMLAAVASLRGYAVNEASAVLFWQHVLAMISLAFSLVVYFKLFLICA